MEDTEQIEYDASILVEAHCIMADRQRYADAVKFLNRQAVHIIGTIQYHAVRRADIDG